MQRGPFISNFGIKLHDPSFHYESSIAKMRSLSSKVVSGRRVKCKDGETKKVASMDKDKPPEGKVGTPDDTAKPNEVGNFIVQLYIVVNFVANSRRVKQLQSHLPKL